MTYLVEVGNIFRKTNTFGVIEYYQIVSGLLEFRSFDDKIHTCKSRYSFHNIIVCLLKKDYEYTTLEPCMNSSKSGYEYKHYKLKKDENYNNFIYEGSVKLEDFFIEDWNKISSVRNPILLKNKIFLKPIISKKVSHTYYDTIEKKNKTIKTNKINI
jgi:hypothetical protein